VFKVRRSITSGIDNFMRQLLPVLTCCLALAAQQSTTKGKSKFDFCGPGSSHECSCLRHTLAVQAAYLADCRANSTSDKVLYDCMVALPWHCTIVNRPAPPVDDEQGEGQTATSDRCLMASKKYDCLCDDGARCHIGHSASEHAEAEKAR
jgi:hypothetical protein